ncbi:hypothetical protein SMD44_08728 [Streptomyces alboflavus]|uniref:Uncharacterized protein n=1 Tax=Streptomyces alboflavus TaxID=67267 RepID=A0A1Z1WS03_9ACTN|nr:hypothetical protein SMD44_08728 [Streptomyces alboflavus]
MPRVGDGDPRVPQPPITRSLLVEADKQEVGLRGNTRSTAGCSASAAASRLRSARMSLMLASARPALVQPVPHGALRGVGEPEGHLEAAQGLDDAGLREGDPAPCPGKAPGLGEGAEHDESCRATRAAYEGSR